jgi:hypothetical protein
MPSFPTDKCGSPGAGHPVGDHTKAADPHPVYCISVGHYIGTCTTQDTTHQEQDIHMLFYPKHRYKSGGAGIFFVNLQPSL